MRTYWGMAIATAVVLLTVGGKLWAQVVADKPAILHIQRSVSTWRTGFPQFVYSYRVLDGVRSAAAARALTGTISLENSSPNFSEVLWVLVSWQGKCPGDGGDLDNASVVWTDILKNPTQSTSTFPVNLQFPQPLPMTGCVGLVFAGGPLVKGKVTMSADLSLTYAASSSTSNTIVDLSGEYCFGQNWGCQNQTTDDTLGFGVPVQLQSGGNLTELYGNVSDSTFDGTQNFGPLPAGKSWGAINDFYLLPGGCGKFENNLNDSGFPNPVPLATLYGWLPENAVHLQSVPMNYEIPEGGTAAATLQKPVQRIFRTPITVASGDCMVVIYGRKGDGATDNETQVHAVLAP